MRSTLFITTLLLAQLVFAQTSRIKHLKESDRLQANTFACHFFDRNTKYLPPPPSAINDEQAERWMHGMINRITSVIGLENRFRVKALFNYNNCSAICFSNDVGQDRFIQFDRAFLENYQRRTKNPWFTLGVLAHELGHHLSGHSLDGIGSRPNKELEADAFAGFVLQKLGCPLAQAQAVFSFLNETDGPPTHPVKKQRYAAIKRGWDNAAGLVSPETLRFNDADRIGFAIRWLQDAREATGDARWKHVQTSLDLAPTYAEAISEKGLVWMERGRYDSAIIYCERAIEREPYIGLLRLNLAKVYYFNKNATLAKSFLQDALFCKPVFPEAYLFIAQVNLDERQWQEALLNTELALRMNPDKEPLRARLLVTHAEALFGLSRFKDAFAVLKKAREVDPKNLKSFILFDEYKKRAGD